MPSAPDQDTAICPGCGGKNVAGSDECDWCGRSFISKRGRLRITVWQLFSTALLLALIGAVAGLAYLNAGRPLTPVRVSAAPTATAPATLAPTPAVTPRVTTPIAPTPTAAPAAAPVATAPLPAPTAAEPPPVEPTPTPQPQTALVVNTSGLGVSVRLEPGTGARRAGVLREGTRVLLTGNDQTVAARPWREIETEDHNLKGWVLGDFLQLQQSAP